MTKTIVVHLSVADFDVYIGRPSKWGNPFEIGKDGTRAQVIQKYEDYLTSNAELVAQLHELKGKRLGCWCKPKPCHGDILVKLINEQTRNSFFSN